MRTILKAEIDLEHEAPMSADDVDTMKYFMREGIEQIIDSSQNYEVKDFKIAKDEPINDSREALFTDILG